MDIITGHNIQRDELLSELKAVVAKLLDHFQSDEHFQTLQSSNRGLIEPLSERELQILQFISEGMSNREIAERLCLSLGTVKVHSHNIYGKLNVSNRTQAVGQARKLGLLSSE